MFLNLAEHEYDRDITPFLRNGVIIDTVVILDIIYGLVETRISRKKLSELPDYKRLLDFFDRLKLTNQWNKFYITPHILTEVCRHVRDTYCKWQNYKEIIATVLPIMEYMGEKQISKNDFLKRIELKNPIIEAGDISIYVSADDLLNKKQKVAILSRDHALNKQYQDIPNVMVMDYQSIILNSL